MSGLGEQIAVLDGITIAPGDGNYGGGASYPDAGRWPLLPSSAGLNGPLGAQNDLMGAARRVYRKREGMYDLPNVAPGKRVFASASGSANMSGGSSYPDDGRFPLLSSTIGLSGFGAASYPRDLPNVAPRKRVFASYSGGANMSGGSNYPDSGQFPTWAQAGAGLAGGCGCSMEGLGTMPNLLPNMRIVASAPQGANYSGGSSYPDSGRFPLLSSTIGLAGFGAAPRMTPQQREQLMAAIQYRSQMLVNTRKAMVAAKNAPLATRQALARAYVANLRVLCVLRSKAGLPTLPECQKLIAAMKRAAPAARRRVDPYDVPTQNTTSDWR